MTIGTTYESERPEHLAQLNAAFDALHAGRHEDARASFQQLAEAGSATAWMNLGWMYQAGVGVERDLSRAQQCYERAMGSGSVMAEHYLATVHRQRGNLAQALRHYESAARAGCLPAIYWAGTMYLKGEGTSPDVRKAHDYLSEAAARGHVFARRDIAVEQMHGRYGKRRLLKGMGEWVRAVTGGMLLARRDPNNERLM